MKCDSIVSNGFVYFGKNKDKMKTIKETVSFYETKHKRIRERKG